MWYRPAKMTDAELLLSWRNDKVTREMSRNQQPVEMADHVAWMERRLQRPAPDLFIAMEMVGDEFAPVATFRIDKNEVSYTVAPEHRGKGIAEKLLRKVHRIYGPLRAEIKAVNTASIRAAERAGHLVVLID